MQTGLWNSLWLSPGDCRGAILYEGQGPGIEDLGCPSGRDLRGHCLPPGSGRGPGQGAVLRPGTGRTTTGGALGVFTLCGINLQKLAIKIWKINVSASFWEYYSCLSSRGSPTIYLRVSVPFLFEGFALVSGHIRAELR